MMAPLALGPKSSLDEADDAAMLRGQGCLVSRGNVIDYRAIDASATLKTGNSLSTTLAHGTLAHGGDGDRDSVYSSNAGKGKNQAWSQES